MKKVYWCVQQINRVGGAEMVSINLANALSQYYDMTIVSTVKMDGDIPYHIDPKVKLMTLGLPRRTERVDVLTKKYLSHFRIISLLALYLQVGFHYFFKKPIYRHRIQKRILSEDATWICSAVDSYMLAPKKGRVFFHFHFTADRFFASDNASAFKMSRIPEKYIFLTKTTRDEVCARKPKIEPISTFIYNPIRFEPILDTEYHNNTLIFAGRFAYQKNPMLALAVAKELKDRNFPFKLKMFGDPIMKDEMEAYINEHSLSDVIELHGPSKQIDVEMRNADLLLLTSVFEGVPLVMNEANALSRPWVSSYWGSAVEEVLIPGKNGVVIKSGDPKEYADRIIEILSDKEKLIQFKKDAYEASEKFSFKSVLPHWRKLIG